MLSTSGALKDIFFITLLQKCRQPASWAGCSGWIPSVSCFQPTADVVVATDVCSSVLYAIVSQFELIFLHIVLSALFSFSS